ncbi:hypothetical protein H0H92_011493 [Tricholoma furcatifolium]|nr:hypothetical protein H0H92_011493 [Tricholoma furcatifolium]
MSTAGNKKSFRCRLPTEEEKFLKELRAAFLGAREEGKLEVFFALLETLWEDRFPDPKCISGLQVDYVENRPGAWRARVSWALSEDARIYGAHTGLPLDNWEGWMSLEADRARRRADFFFTAERFGVYLGGHQYDVAVSLEDRVATEVSPEEFFERALGKVLAGIAASFRGD